MDMIDQRTRLLRQILRRHFSEVDPHGSFDEGDFLHARGSARNALLYASLYCPHLVEIDGSVLLGQSLADEGDIERFRECVERNRGDRESAEGSFNLVEVAYLFGPGGRDTSDEEDRFLAENVALAWRGWLRVNYPGRNFVVEVIDPEETGSVVGLSFYERRQ